VRWVPHFAAPRTKNHDLLCCTMPPAVALGCLVMWEIIMLRVCLLLVALTLAAGSAQAGLTSNALSSNALSSNALSSNALGDARIVAIELPAGE